MLQIFCSNLHTESHISCGCLPYTIYLYVRQYLRRFFFTFFFCCCINEMTLFKYQAKIFHSHVLCQRKVVRLVMQKQYVQVYFLRTKTFYDLSRQHCRYRYRCTFNIFFTAFPMKIFERRSSVCHIRVCLNVKGR